MAEKSIEEKVKDIIVEQLGVNPEQVTPQASFIEDLGADSLDIVELVMAFEEEFSVEVPDEDAEKLQTVGDVIKYIGARQAAVGAYLAASHSRVLVITSEVEEWSEPEGRDIDGQTKRSSEREQTSQSRTGKRFEQQSRSSGRLRST